MSQDLGHDPSIELLKPDIYAQYLLRDAREIAYVLRQIASRAAMTTAWFGSASDFMLTTLLAVSPDNRSVLLDVGSDERITDAAVRADHLQCATELDRVKIQFSLHHIAHASHDGRPALSAALPETLLRLQRREHFRISTPTMEALTCRVPLTDGKQHSVRVLDISGGGVGLLFAPGAPEVELEQKLAGCLLELPDGVVQIALEVRNLRRVTLRNGQQTQRAGCAFVTPGAALSSQIQRYIFRIERERKQLS